LAWLSFGINALLKKGVSGGRPTYATVKPDDVVEPLFSPLKEARLSKLNAVEPWPNAAPPAIPPANSTLFTVLPVVVAGVIPPVADGKAINPTPSGPVPKGLTPPPLAMSKKPSNCSRRALLPLRNPDDDRLLSCAL